MDFKPTIPMKNKQEVIKEAEHMFKTFMDPTTKKPLRDECYNKYHSLMWVLEDEENLIEKRLREINAERTETPDTK